MDYIILWSFFLEFHEKQDIKKTTRTNSQLSLNISENEDESDVKQVCTITLFGRAVGVFTTLLNDL